MPFRRVFMWFYFYAYAHAYAFQDEVMLDACSIHPQATHVVALYSLRHGD